MSEADQCRCNAGGETGNDTETITMAAGDPFTFTTDTAVYHDGPLSMFDHFPKFQSNEISLTIHRYMAKAPAAAVDFDGSGQVWFKILDLGPTFGSGTVTWPLARIVSPLCLSNRKLRHISRNIHVQHPQKSSQR